MEFLRAFIVLPLSVLAVEQVSPYAESLKSKLPTKTQFLEKSDWHVTLVFFSRVSHHTLSELWHSLRASLSGFPSLNLSLSHTGGLPEKKPHACVLFIRKNKLLCDLYQRVMRHFSTLIDSGRHFSFTPHVTIARFPPQNSLELPEEQFSSFCFEGTEIALYQSHPERAGSRYEILDRIQLTSIA